MCGLVLFDVFGQPIREASEASTDTVFGIGKLRHYERDLSFEIAVLRNEGFGNFEVVSDRAIKGTAQEIMIALQDLGFAIFEEQCRKMFDFIQTLIGEKKKN